MEKPSRTIVITAPYFPPYGGGLERYAYEIAIRLKRDYGWRVIIITSGEHYGKDVKEEMDGLTIYRLSYRIKISNTPLSLGWIKKIRNILTAENPDVINIHAPVPGIGDIARLFARRKQVILTYHTGSMKKGRPIFDAFIWLYERFILNILLQRANHIICSSDYIRLNFLKQYQFKSTTITPAVDTDLFKPDPTKKSKEPTILFVAGLNRAEQHKGLQTLLEALKMLKKNIPSVRLIVVGEGDMKSEYKKRIIAMELENSVIFAGRLSGEKLAERYQQAHVFALPSRNESFGMVILEAMASELPVIATNSGGIPWLIEHNRNGLVFSPDDVRSLAEGIEIILTNKDLENKLKKNGVKEVGNLFSWDNKASETFSIFQKVITHSKENVEKMNVLIICKEYPPHVVGGLGVHYFELVQKLKEYCTVNLICGQEKEGAKNEEHSDNLHIYRIKIPSVFPFNHIVFNILAFIRSLKIKKDIIHLCSPFGILNVLIKQLPIVVKMHTVYANQGGARLYNNVYFPIAALIDKLIISKSNFVMTTSSFMKREICEKYKIMPSKISVIHNGIDNSIFEANAINKDLLKDELSIPRKSKIVLYVGRFVQRKGALNLVKAAPAIVKKEPNVLFVLIGGGFTEGAEYEKTIRSLVDTSGLQDNVLLLPWMSHEKVLKYYKVADIFVHPATYEPFGNIIVEAMAAGLPVIASKSGGPEEIIKDSGIILENNEPALISKSVSDLIADDELRKNLSLLSRERAKDFSWDSTARETMKVYRMVIGSRYD